MTIWADEDSTTLEDLWKQGLSSAQCGQVLHRTRNSVIGRVHRMGLEHGESTAPPAVVRRPGRPRHVIRRTTNPQQFVRETGELIEKPQEAVLSPPVSFMDLKNHHCRWPIDGEDGETWYCGCAKISGFPYCFKHVQMAYIKLPAVMSDEDRTKRARDRQKAMAMMGRIA